MKSKTIIPLMWPTLFFAVCGLTLAFFTGVAAAEAEKEKASVVAKQFDNVTQITIVPTEGYKWNTQYPAKIKFSVCSEISCSFYSKDIIIKEK